MKTSSLLYSVIIPVYKVEKYLDRCVQSVLAQTYRNIEIILVDDGSPDNCPILCDEWVKKDNRISVIHKSNGGLSSARNVGLQRANGEYIVFLDSDDWWCDNTALERISNKIEECNADVIFFASKKYYSLKDKYLESVTAHNCLSSLPFIRIEDAMRNSLFLACAWDKVIRRSVLKDNKIEFIEHQLSEDIEWCCKLLQLDLKYACISGIVHVYRQQNATSITSNITNRNLFDIYNVICKYSQISNETCNIHIKNFLALELLLLMAITHYAAGEEGKNLVKDIGKFFYLMKYNLYPRVKKLSKIRFLGYRIVRRILVSYINYRRI